MYELLGRLLFSANFFYPLLLVSAILTIYAIFKQSWIVMVISALTLLPSTLYFLYTAPPFQFSIMITLIQLIVAALFYKKSNKGRKSFTS